MKDQGATPEAVEEARVYIKSISDKWEKETNPNDHTGCVDFCGDWENCTADE